MPQAVEGAVRGSYRLVRRLGAGGSGEVWVGRHVVTDGIGAVKLLRARRRRQAYRGPLAHEASVIARLVHPHIVSLFELGAEHIVTAYIDGSDLSRRMRSGIDPALAQRIAVQIGSALACAHAHGIVHHDVKPANILIDRNDNVFLGDFGLASLSDQPESGSLRGGTPGFMAPEQERGEPTTPAADQFSLGRTIIEILAGGTDRADVELALALLPATAAPLLPVLRRATASEPADRFASMDEFVTAVGSVALVDVAPAVRLASEKRSLTPFAWTRAASHSVEAAPAIVRAEYKLSELEAAGLLPAAACAQFRETTGYADFGWSLYARSDRLGPISPSLPSRASELVVLCHGWMGTREVWPDLALALCRDNADALVLAPDVSGFGDSRYANPTPRQLSPESLTNSLMTWLTLLGVRDLPGVVVGHSMSGLGLLAGDPAAFGERLARVVLTPAIFQLTPFLRFLSLLINRLIKFSEGRPWLHRWLSRMMRRPNDATRLMSDEQLQGISRQFERIAPRMLAAASRAMYELVLPSEALRGVELIFGAHDPVLPPRATARALAELGGTRDRAHVMASGGHNPHVWSDKDPEGSQRNQAELVQIIGSVLLSAVDAVSTSTLALSRTV